jgi:hypothetical protein
MVNAEDQSVEDQSTEPDEKADLAEVVAETGRIRELLEKVRPVAGPVVEPWSFGFGYVLGEHPQVPKRLRGLVRKLDRFGGMSISQQSVGFDGEDVDWDKVTQVRTRNLVEYLLSDAVDEQLATLPVPWFPGRKRLLDAISRAVLTLLVASVKEQLDSRGVDIRIPAEIEYKGALRRTKELGPGVFAALVLADPAVSQCVQATAAAKGIPVVAAQDDLMDNAEERAAAIRAKLAKLESKFRRFRD